MAVRWGLPNAVQNPLRAYYLTRKVLAEKYLEPEMAVLRYLVGPGQAAIDIGANVGFYTMFLARLVGPSGRVYSFEPISENHKILDRVVRSGRLGSVKTFLAAVDRQPGEREMVIPNNSDFTGFYQARLAGTKDLGQRQLVKVVSLDQLWSDGTLPSLDFIKCDAEGSELGILQGGIRLLKRFHPSLLLEVQHKTGAEVFDFLYGLGYKSFVLDGEFVEVDQFNSRFWNYFFLKRTGTPKIPIRSASGPAVQHVR
jgi:FkbM family methyltransferase